MTKRVMVLGCGQVGTFTVRSLVNMGATVYAADIKPTPGYFSRFGQASAVELLTADICDEATISELFSEHRPDVVVLTAGPVGQAVSREPESAWKIHTKGAEVTTNCTSKADVQRLVFVSSLAVYGHPETDRISEEVVPEPQSEYGRTKFAAEQAVLACGNASLDRRILRTCGVYGPIRIGVGSHSARFIESLLLSAARNKKVVIESSAYSCDQYLYAKDLGRAVALVALGETTSSDVVYNVGPGFTTNADDLYSALRVAAPDAEIQVHRNATNDHPAMPPLDVSRIRDTYGFSPQYSLIEGLVDFAKEGGFV